MQAYYPLTHVGVTPHHKYGQTDNTAPHKLYHNMLAGVPNLVSSCHTLQRIITDTRSGLVFDAGFPKAAAARLEQLTDPKLRDDLAANGRRAVTKAPYSWAHAVSSLEGAYRRSP
jgi:hypothetical protein